MKEEIKELKERLNEAVLQANTDSELVSIASTAIGMLEVLKDFNMHQLMYDMAKVSAMAGNYPDEWGDR